MSTSKLTPDERLVAMESKLAKVDDLESSIETLKGETELLKSENERLSDEIKAEKDRADAAEDKVTDLESKLLQAKDPEETEPEASDKNETAEPESQEKTDNAGLTKEDLKSAVEDATSGMTEVIESLKAEVADLKSGSSEAGKTKQPGGEESAVEAEESGGIAGDRNTGGENAYAELFAKDPEIAKINPEGISYEDAKSRDDNYGLNLLSSMVFLHGTEKEFKEKTQTTA